MQDTFNTLVWSDDFDGLSLDYSKWEIEVNAFGGGNHELQIYTDRTENVRVENSLLVIEACADNAMVCGTTRRYSSGRVRTKNRGDWQYGRIEVRARLPEGTGLWPAIWMLPTTGRYGTWAASGEIDIMECLGSDPTRAFGTLHHGGQWPRNKKCTAGEVRSEPGESFADGFHVWGIDWLPDRITWHLDGKRFGEITSSQWYSENGPSPAPFDQPFHLIMNLAVGGDWPGPPDASTRFPQRLEVDWVKVFQ